MKKVLILAYDFPPYISVGGIRPHSWKKYMLNNHIFPVVITRQWDNNNDNVLDFISASKVSSPIIEENESGVTIKTPYCPNLSNRLFLKYGESRFRFFRKAISAFYEYFQYLFLIGPKMPIYNSAKKYLTESNVDLILVTGEPFILFKYASKLSEDFNVPWVADYRDPWSQNNSRGDNFLRVKWDSFFEKRYLKNVSEIITVSDHFKSKISELLPDRNYNVIKTGFDSDVINGLRDVAQNDQTLLISFAGSVYEWHPLVSFLTTFKQFLDELEDGDVQVNFYGLNKSKFHSDVKAIIDSKFPELESYINIYPKLPHKDILRELAKANLFLLFNDYISVGTKIYDYLGLRRQIVFCYTNSEESEVLKKQYYNLDSSNFSNTSLQQGLIKETNSGVNIENSNHLKRELHNYYKEFKANGKIECNSVEIDKYSQENQVKLLSKILLETIDNYKNS
jgi:hypothetical protein